MLVVLTSGSRTLSDGISVATGLRCPESMLFRTIRTESSIYKTRSESRQSSPI